jgi:hypothetical protein
MLILNPRITAIITIPGATTRTLAVAQIESGKDRQKISFVTDQSENELKSMMADLIVLQLSPDTQDHSDGATTRTGHVRTLASAWEFSPTGWDLALGRRIRTPLGEMIIASIYPSVIDKGLHQDQPVYLTGYDPYDGSHCSSIADNQNLDYVEDAMILVDFLYPHVVIRHQGETNRFAVTDIGILPKEPTPGLYLFTESRENGREPQAVLVGVIETYDNSELFEPAQPVQ